MIQDSAGRQFTFNGDNRQVEVRILYITVGQYYFDGTGNRIKKVTASELTVYIYNAYGKIVSEFGNNQATIPTTNYTTEDTQGSPRVVTDSLGAVYARRDFMPFGEELYANTAGRTAANKYGNGSDSVRQRYTGYEKDIETGLDFAEARMYDNRYGRFTAIDPLLASGKSANPQTFNRYAYVANNPIRSTDPSGMSILGNNEFDHIPFLEVDMDLSLYAAYYGWRRPPMLQAAYSIRSKRFRRTRSFTGNT